MYVKNLLVLLSIFLCFGCEKQDKPNPLGDILEAGVEGGRIPGVIAIASSSDREIFQGAAGTRDLSDGTPMTVDTIVRIASLTKAITSAAVMQLIESGKIGLDDPASEYLPRLAGIEVLEGFNAEGEPMRRPPKSPVTIRQLLTHTSGYVYEIWNPNAATNVALGHVDSITAGGDGFTFAPLAFDPGTRWEYGVGTDVLGHGVPFGDGLRCVGRNMVRLGVQTPDSAGSAIWGPDLGTSGAWAAGDTRYFQVWYRDVAGPCGSGFNLTNGMEVLFLP